ncbi:MAG: arginine N-succinyltransferase [Thermodesulfobacteriota bacterium]
MNTLINIKKSDSGKTLPVVLAIILITIIGAVFWVKQNLYAKPFDQVLLTPPEQSILDKKLEKLKESSSNSQKNLENISFVDERPDPKPYSEKGLKREIKLSERDLNSLITDPQIAKTVAVDLSDDLLSVKMLIPMDEEFPILGGKTIKIHFGTILAYRDNNLVVAIKGISIGGIPLPSAWWGGIKNRNLVEYFDGKTGFWNTLASGISDVKISEGEMYIKLKE